MNIVEIDRLAPCADLNDKAAEDICLKLVAALLSPILRHPPVYCLGDVAKTF